MVFHGVVEDKLVDGFRGHARPNDIDKNIESLRRELPCAPHPFECFRPMKSDFTVVREPEGRADSDPFMVMRSARRALFSVVTGYVRRGLPAVDEAQTEIFQQAKYGRYGSKSQLLKPGARKKGSQCKPQRRLPPGQCSIHRGGGSVRAARYKCILRSARRISITASQLHLFWAENIKDLYRFGIISGTPPLLKG